MIQRVTYNAIILFLSVAALSLWGTLSQVGIDSGKHCGEYTDGNIGMIITLLVVVGATLAGYGVAVNNEIDKDREDDVNLGIWYQLALIAGHLLAVAFAIMLIDHHFDDDLNCKTFTGRQNFFLYVFIIFISVSGLMLLYSIALTWEVHGNDSLKADRDKMRKVVRKYQTRLKNAEKNGHRVTIAKCVIYTIVTFVFFFFATAPASGVSSFSGSHLYYTLGASGVVLVLSLVPLIPACRKGDTKKEEDEEKYTIQEKYKRWWHITQGIVALVLSVNIGLSIAIIEDDLQVVQQTGSIVNGSTSCFDQNEHVLDMNMTAIGFWALYIIILSGAFVQTVYRMFKPVETVEFNVLLERLWYSDTHNSLDMPTFWIVFTWVWVTAASITHHGDYTSDHCKFTHEKELSIMILHSVGFAVVLLVLPWVYGKIGSKVSSGSRQSERDDGVAMTADAKSSAAILRPTNRFTTKAQVAVDVNTPLNFA